MSNNNPDPLEIREMNERHNANYNLVQRYYWRQSIDAVSTADGAYCRISLDSNIVTEWHSTYRDAYAELADKIRAWEKENPELAIKDELPCES